jgi:hypothetical protein
MVGSFGMAGSLISLEAVRGTGAANVVAKVLSDDRGRDTVESILGRARDEVRTLLTDHSYLVEALRDVLLEREELIGPEITDVLAAAERAHREAVVDLRVAHLADGLGEVASLRDVSGPELDGREPSPLRIVPPPGPGGDGADGEPRPS